MAPIIGIRHFFRSEQVRMTIIVGTFFRSKQVCMTLIVSIRFG